MSIEVACSCGKRFQVREELAGKRGKCSGCGAVIVIPAPPPPQEMPDDVPDIYDVADEEPVAERWHVATPAAALAPAAATVRIPPAPMSTGRPAQLVQRNGRSLRDWLYLLLIAALLPLLWSTFYSAHRSMRDRFRDTLSAHPEVRRSLAQLARNGKLSDSAVFGALPDHRLQGAWLAYGSEAHWLYALLGAGAFFGLALLLLPVSSTRPQHAFFTGLFTGTAGVLLLLAVQFIASMMRGYIIIPHSILGLFLLILKGIQVSYDAANRADSSFIGSFLGFTLGVGLCEELCKALPLLWHYRAKGTLDWRGACLWGFLSGVGFGLSEAIMYSSHYYNGIVGGDMYLVRFISCVGLHGIWAAAAGIFIAKHASLIQDAESWLPLFLGCIALVAVPMVLHGLYDTMLKKDMDGAALIVALVSFGWLVFQVEQARRSEAAGRSPAYA